MLRRGFNSANQVASATRPRKEMNSPLGAGPDRVTFGHNEAGGGCF